MGVKVKVVDTSDLEPEAQECLNEELLRNAARSKEREDFEEGLVPKKPKPMSPELQAIINPPAEVNEPPAKPRELQNFLDSKENRKANKKLIKRVVKKVRKSRKSAKKGS